MRNKSILLYALNLLSANVDGDVLTDLNIPEKELQDRITATRNEIGFPVGVQVEVTPWPRDSFTHQFQGVVTGYRSGDIIVRDQNDDHFQVEFVQLRQINE